MTAYQQYIALLALIRYELIRMRRIAVQVFLAPLITTGLYLLIFGSIVGQRVGMINGMSYIQYIVPGLILLAVLTNAYSNVATSLYSTRFQKSIEEFLVTPAPNYILLLGYCMGGMLRGLIISVVVLSITCFFVPLNIMQLPIMLAFVLLIALCFSLGGFLNALLANSFEDIALIPTFILSPLTYLGGIFYSISMLPPSWQMIAQYNPISYMITTFRQSMYGLPLTQLTPTLVILMGLIAFLTQINLYLLRQKRGNIE